MIAQRDNVRVPVARLSSSLSVLKDARLLERRELVSQFNLAIADFAAALQLWPLWIRLGWNDILHRYRTLGPGAVLVNGDTRSRFIALGLVYSQY